MSDKDLADAYRWMIGTSAWKDFNKTILDDLMESTLKEFDQMYIDQSSAFKLCSIQGKRNILKTIRDRIEMKLKGQ